MYPGFSGSSKQKNVNLSSGPAAKSREQVLQEAAALRSKREAQRRNDTATRVLQRVWRGKKARKDFKGKLRADVIANTSNGIWTEDTVKSLVWGYAGEGVGNQTWALARQGNPANVLLPLSQPEALSYLSTLKRLCYIIILQASRAIPPLDSQSALETLAFLLQPSSYNGVLPGSEPSVMVLELTTSICAAGGVPLLVTALSNINTTDKKNPRIPHIINILVALLQNQTSTHSILSALLPLNLLPNRLPIPSLTLLARNFPLQNILAYSQTPEGRTVWSSWQREDRLNVLSNLAAFGTPTVKKMDAKTKSTWSEFLGGLLSGLEGGIEISGSDTSGASSLSKPSHIQDSDESDVEIVSHPSALVPSTPKRPKFKPIAQKLLSHLQALATPAHIDSLFTPTPAATSPVYNFVLALVAAWPKKFEAILGAIESKRGSFKELWRGVVRGSLLYRKIDACRGGGKEVNAALKDPALVLLWPSFLLLTLMHIHLLHAMGDDEFFSPTLNPLSLDETVSLSGLWRNIAFALYWNPLPEGKLAWGWTAEDVRKTVDRAMSGVYERDSRRQFTSPGHWVMIGGETTSVDARGFVEAAIAEERELDSASAESDELDPMFGDSRNARMRLARRVMSKRHLAFLSPRLGVLNNIPEVVPFELRVEIFRAFIRNDRERLGIQRYSASSRTYHATVHRGKIAQDGYSELNALGPGLKSTIAITFIDQFGQEEAGIDGGGVFKEFLTSLSKEVFNTDRGLWLGTKQNELYPNPHAYAKETHQLDWYQFVGRVLGKALYEGVLADVSFARFFLSKWRLGQQSYFDDLASMDEELYDGLIKLKHYDGNFEDLALTFTIDVDDFGATETIDLIPNGSNVAVTKANRMSYIELVSNYKLNLQIKLQCEAFFLGLADIIDPKWIRMFSPTELGMLVGGVDGDIDIDDLRRNSVSHGLSEVTERTFWEVVRGFDPAERRALVKFVTSCPRPPMLGFKELQPLFSIRGSGSDPHRLPSSATCVNLLKLPGYTDARTMRTKLLQAISSESGFDLS